MIRLFESAYFKQRTLKCYR